MRPAADELYASEVGRMLWPAPWSAPTITRDSSSDKAHVRDAYLFPSRRRPRLLVPVDLPAAAGMLHRLGRGNAGLRVPVRRLLESSVRSRAFALARWPRLRISADDPAARSIETYLSDCLGIDVRVGVLLGTRRANQKPVLQLFARDGRPLGFAKIGHNDLTADLVRREAASLATVGGRAPSSFRAPKLLHHGEWAGLEVLVMSALTTSPRLQVTRTDRIAAMREVAHLTGTTGSSLADSGFWARLHGDAGRLSAAPMGDRLRSAVDALEQHRGAEPVQLGCWHGDWGAWNMGLDDSNVLQLWDWERFDAEVPLGFDGLHFAVQALRPGKRDASRREDELVASVPALLTELGVPHERHDLTLRLYLLEMAVRYVDALTRSDTPPLRRRTDWVLGFLERLLAQPHPVLLEGRS